MNLKQTIRRILREETEPNKANLVRKMIHRLYDNVSFIEQSTFNGKPHLTIYFDSDDTAANIESWFDEKISKDIKELTSGFINVCPDWAFHWDSRKKEADVYINTELLRYDNLGNVINESSKSIRRILKEEDYSPAGKEIIPNKIVVHKSNPMFRDKILQDGLKVRAGECYKIYVGYGIKCRPAIFATNSTNKRAWFDSTYDDDVWEINTEMIPDVKWYKDRHFESRSKHIVTFQDIPKEAITLKYEGTGSGDVKLWSKNSPNIVEESIRRILREEMNLLLEVYTEDELKTQYLDRGLVSKEEFFQVISMFQKPFYRNWILKRISEKVIPLKNIDAYKEYLKVFEKNKDSYPIKDLGLIKSEEDVGNFEEISKNLINLDIDVDKESNNYISHNNIKKLHKVGIKFLGITNNKFQVFMIPKSSNSNETWVAYKNILGNCTGRKEGKKIEFCTIANFNKFSEYLLEGNLYVLYNFSDQNSPYQFFYDGKKMEFKNNQNLTVRNYPEICDIYRFLREKNLLDKIDNYELSCMTDEEINNTKKISNTKEKYHRYKKIIFDLLDDLFKRDLTGKEKDVINVIKYKEYNIVNKYLIHLIYEFLSKEYDTTLYDIQTISKIILEYYKSKLGDDTIFPTNNQGDLSIQERIVGINFFNGWGIKNFLTN